MNTYTVITLGVIALPLVLSFDRKVAFHTHWKAVFFSMLPVSSVYLIWDVLVTRRGDWSFNPVYAGDFRLLGLPVGEWLFFITVPYACIFIYEVVRAYFPDRVCRRQQPETPSSVYRIGAAAVLLAAAGMVIFRDNDYSFLALLSFLVWIAVTLIWNPWLFREIHTLWFFLFSTIAFLLVNGILTGLPIVEYNPEAIWGIRIITIPLEDLFYNFSLLGLTQNIYVRIKGYGARYR